MKVMITGGMGVMGAEATRRFVAEGHRPVVVARHREDRLLGDLRDRIDFEPGDILDLPRLLDIIKRHAVTHIVHAAAFVGAVSAQNPALSIQVNVMGTVNVLEAARAFDVQRLVFTSAKGVYGPILGKHAGPDYEPMPEDMPKAPQRIYDSAKLMAEQTVLYYAANFNVDAAVLRFATTYGPGKTARHGKMGVTSDIVEAPFNGLPFRHPHGADALDDFVYNKDSAYGIYLATVADSVPSRVYNIGSGKGHSLGDIAREVRRRIPGADISIGPGDNFFGSPQPMHGIYDIGRARRELGYEPQYDVARAVDDYVDSLERMRAETDIQAGA